jgi:hypothetical protein
MPVVGVMLLIQDVVANSICIPSPVWSVTPRQVCHLSAFLKSALQ